MYNVHLQFPFNDLYFISHIMVYNLEIFYFIIINITYYYYCLRYNTFSKQYLVHETAFKRNTL